MSTQPHNGTPPESELFYDELIGAYVGARRFIPRLWLAEQVQQALDQPGCRFVLLTAEPGAGKTAFMAWLAGQHRDWPRYFIRRDQIAPLDDPGPRSFLRRIGYQLAATYPALFRREAVELQVRQRIGSVAERGEAVGAEIDRILASPFHQTAIHIGQEVERVGGRVIGLRVREVVADPGLLPVETLQDMALFDPLRALQTHPPGAPVVILVDALDELKFRPTGETVLRWLETYPEPVPNLRFVLTSRPDNDLLACFRSARAGRIVEIKDFQEDVHVPADVKAFARCLASEPAIAAALGSPAAVDNFVQLAHEKANRNLGYLDAIARAADAAVAAGDQGLLSKVLALQALPGTLEALYAHFLHLIKQGIQGKSVTVTDPLTHQHHYLDAWPAVFRPTLGVLSVAREPLSAPQIRHLGGIDADQSEVDAALTRCAQFLDRESGGVRLYHTTLPAFLTAAETRANPDTEDLWIDPADSHAQIAAAYLDLTNGALRLPKVEGYGLRHLAAHLWELRQAPPFRAALHSLADDRLFLRRRLDHAGSPGPVLEDVARALAVALEDDDLAWTWRHILAYRRVAHEERGFARVVEATGGGNYRQAVERTALYADLPNSQALARLWIAWEAAVAERWEDALAAAQRGLEYLLARGVVAARLRQAEPDAEPGINDVIGEALQRLLARIARRAADPVGWLAEATRSWPPEAVAGARSYLNMPPAEWGKAFDDQTGGVPFPVLLERIRGHLAAANQPLNFRDASFIYQRQLTASLYNDRGEAQWATYVRQAVDQVSLDDYPSYREVAMAWLAQAVLAQDQDDQDDTLSRSGLATVLEGVFRPAAPGFWGDTVAAALDGVAQEKGQATDKGYLFAKLELVEASNERVIDPAVYRKPEDIRAWRQAHGLRVDPWAYAMRQHSAVAAVLRRRGDTSGDPSEAEAYLRDAETLLREAEAEGHDRSYGGFRALARLSLACRRLEWGQEPMALAQIQAAAADVEHMLDPVLKQERAALVTRVPAWIAAHGAAMSEEAGLALLQSEAGMARGLAFDFLSARWHDDPARLKQLLPLALNDATAAGAVLGRLLGVLAARPQPTRPFLALLEAMDLTQAVP